jgi:hypothetical protein
MHRGRARFQISEFGLNEPATRRGAGAAPTRRACADFGPEAENEGQVKEAESEGQVKYHEFVVWPVHFTKADSTF